MNGIETGATGDQTATEYRSTFRTSWRTCYSNIDETYDLGSSTYKFRTLYLAGDTIKLGDSDIKSDSDGNISVFDGGTTTLKKLIVDELEIGWDR